MEKITNYKDILNINKLSLFSLSVFLSYLTNYRFFIWDHSFARFLGIVYFLISLFPYFLISKKLKELFISINNYFYIKIKKASIKYEQKFDKYITFPLYFTLGGISILLVIITNVLFYVASNFTNQFDLSFIAEDLNLKVMPLIMILMFIISSILSSIYFYKIEKNRFLRGLFVSSLSLMLFALILYIVTSIAYWLFWFLTLIVSISKGPFIG